MTQPYPPTQTAWTREPVPRWDQPVTVVLLLLLGLLALAASFFGAFLGMASDGCSGPQDCNYTQLNVALVLAMGGPWVVLIGASVLAIVRMANHRRAFWVPLVAALGVTVPLLLAVILADAAT